MARHAPIARSPATRPDRPARSWSGRAAALALILAALAGPASAEAIRLAAWNLEMARAGPGVLLRDLLRGDEAAEHAADRIAARAPDVLLVMGLDWDHEGRALAAFAAMLDARGLALPHMHAPRPNRGLMTGLDLDGDGRLGEPDDAQGWGRFLGENGMAVLSRWPIEPRADLTGMLWRDLPGASFGPGYRLPEETAGAQRLSSTGHWDLEVATPGGPLGVLAWHAGPPVFDGPEDRNGRRNADEARLWALHLDGALGPAPEGPLVVMGDANLDPLDGDGRSEVMAALIAHPRLRDPEPRGGGADAPQEAADRGHRGDPGLDTVDWPGADDGDPGNLRVTHVLPSVDLRVVGSGVDWPADDRPEGASRHGLVWVDVEMP